jgi:hypothetical protein
LRSNALEEGVAEDTRIITAESFIARINGNTTPLIVGNSKHKTAPHLTA